MIKTIFFATIFSITILAEVRVYQYMVLNNVETISEPNDQIMTSTLNPTAFIAYHGGKRVISVDLLRTWMCFGNTAGKDLCPPPMSKLEPGVLP